MEQIGSLHEKGFSLKNLEHAKKYFEKLGASPEIIELHNLVLEKELPENQ